MLKYNWNGALVLVVCSKAVRNLDNLSEVSGETAKFHCSCWTFIHRLGLNICNCNSNQNFMDLPNDL